tara:strand:+ start:299 stop:628 length:330 start_codon:yes stop_codon:yes gene_type:complete
MKRQNDVPGVLTLYAYNADTINPIHLANIYGVLKQAVKGQSNIGKLQTDERFQLLMRNTIDKLKFNPDWFDVRAIATITHFFGKLKIANHEFFDEIVKVSERARSTITK